MDLAKEEPERRDAEIVRKELEKEAREETEAKERTYAEQAVEKEKRAAETAEEDKQELQPRVKGHVGKCWRRSYRCKALNRNLTPRRKMSTQTTLR